jgi:hypothetical protein
MTGPASSIQKYPPNLQKRPRYYFFYFNFFGLCKGGYHFQMNRENNILWESLHLINELSVYKETVERIAIRKALGGSEIWILVNLASFLVPNLSALCAVVSDQAYFSLGRGNQGRRKNRFERESGQETGVEKTEST